MRKLLKNGIFRNLISAVLFGVIYSLLSFIDKGYVEIGIVLTSMVLYFLLMCFVYFIEVKLRKKSDHKEENS